MGVVNEGALRGISCICGLGVGLPGGFADLEQGGLDCDNWEYQYLYVERRHGELTFLASSFEYSFSSAKNI